MISGLGLTKFQGFNDSMEFELKPLTFIFGPNASGKSSITRSLLLLKQSLTVDVTYFANSVSGFTYDGPDISLASFANVVYGHDEDSEIQLKVKVDDLQSPLQRHSPNSPVVKEVGVTFSIGSKPPFNGIKFEFNVPDLDEDVILEFRFVGKVLKLVSWQGLESLQIAQEKGGENSLGQSVDGEFPSAENGWTNENSYREPSLSNTLTWDVVAKDLSFRLRNNFPTLAMPFQTEGIDRAKNRLLEFLLSLARVALVRQLRSVRHVGPLRDISERLSYVAGVVEDDGEGSADQPDSVSPQKAVSDWLFKLTEGRYRFNPVEFYAEPVRFLGSLKSQILVDTASNTPVTFADVGVGLSQVLPILQAMQIPPKRSNSTLLLVEQPELHLHPAMQANLADLFIDAVSSAPQIQIVAETHSETMLLRLQKRMREGKLDPNTVQILYVDKGSSGNQVMQITPDINDDFSISMPISFTRLRLEDLL